MNQPLPDIVVNYICPLHKVEQTGIYRPLFLTTLHETLLNASIGTAMSLYKSVVHGCHCQTNYKEFDKIIESSTRSSEP